MNESAKSRTIVFLIILSVFGGLGGAWVSFKGFVLPKFSDISLKQIKNIKIPNVELSWGENQAVKVVVDDYFHAWQAENPASMYTFLTTSDQQATTQDEYVKQFQEYPVKPLKYLVKKIEMTEPGKAKVTVLVSWPNVDMDSNIDRNEEIVLISENNRWKIKESESLNK